MNVKSILLNFSCLFILLTGVVRGSHAQSLPDPGLIAMEKMRFDAMIRQDTVTLSRILANDLIYIHTNGVIDDKTSLLKSIASGSVVYKYILPEKSITRVEGNFGWVYGKANIRFKVASINMTIDQYISFINFYRYFRNQWLLVACQNAKVNTDIPDFNKPPAPQVKKSIQPAIY
jgi:hypothetical protein